MLNQIGLDESTTYYSMHCKMYIIMVVSQEQSLEYRVPKELKFEDTFLAYLHNFALQMVEILVLVNSM